MDFSPALPRDKHDTESAAAFVAAGWERSKASRLNSQLLCVQSLNEWQTIQRPARGAIGRRARSS